MCMKAWSRRSDIRFGICTILIPVQAKMVPWCQTLQVHNIKNLILVFFLVWTLRQIGFVCFRPLAGLPSPLPMTTASRTDGRHLERCSLSTSAPASIPWSFWFAGSSGRSGIPGFSIRSSHRSLLRWSPSSSRASCGR